MVYAAMASMIRGPRLDFERARILTVIGMTLTARRLGTTDTHLTPLALGAMVMGTLTPEDESRRILDHYIGEVTPRYTAPDGSPAQGMVDTADCYCWWNARMEPGGHSEGVLRRWLETAGARERVYLATKGTALIKDLAAVWDGADEPNWDLARTLYAGAAPQTLRDSLAGSLERLGLDSVDLYYVHVDDKSTPLEETLEALADFMAEGRIRAYGWSNVRTWRLARIREICAARGWPQPVALQQQHTYLRRRAGLRHGSIVDDEQMDYLEDHPDLQLVAYSPILKGVYNDPAKREGHWAMGPYEGPDAEARIAELTAVSAEAGCTPNQAVLAWMLAGRQPSIIPLIGPRTWDQYLESIEALDVELTQEQVARLDAAGA